MNLGTSRVEQNEQVKAVDFDFAFESIASNIALAIRRIVGQTESDILIGGVVTAAPGSSMNIIISEILASGLYSFALDTEQIGPIGVSASTTADRRDIVQVRGVYEGYDSKQRGFYDTDTDIVTYAFIDTKKKLAVEVSVKAGVPGSVSAPTTDDGYIKIAEILIPAGSINITDGNIFNVTADISGVENNYWKTEKSRSFRVGGINDIKTLFRVQHEASGAHKDNVIGANSIKIGNAQNFLNGSIIPNGASALIGSENLPATTTIPNMIASVLAYINTEIADRKKLSEITTQVSSDMTLGSFEKNTRRYLFNPSENNITISMKSGEKIKEEASFVLLSKELAGIEKISETGWVFVSRNLVDASTVLGKMPGTRGLDYLQSGTVAQMAAKVLSDLKTVDGSGSGLDADLLDGQHGSYYAPKDHASSETTYGVSSEANYGHAKASTVSGSANGTASKGSTPAVFAQSNHVHPTDTTRAPTSHASTATTYGVSSEANYGHAKASTVSGSANGTASKGTTPTVFAQSNHVHPTDTTRAPLASPALTGTPTAPTPATTTNNTQVATTAFVKNQKYEPNRGTGANSIALGTDAVAPRAYQITIGDKFVYLRFAYNETEATVYNALSPFVNPTAGYSQGSMGSYVAYEIAHLYRVNSTTIELTSNAPSLVKTIHSGSTTQIGGNLAICTVKF